MSKKSYIKWSIIGILVFFSIWSVLTFSNLIEPYFLPNPIRVIQETYNLFVHENYVKDLIDSSFRVLVSFVISVVTAIPIGVLMGRILVINALIEPFIVFMRYVPISAFIPLLILWTGIGTFQKIVFLWLGIFFYLVSFIANETILVPEEYIDTAFTLGASKNNVLWKVILPASLPGILNHIRVMLGAGWTYLVLAEIIASNSGIGYRIMQAQRYLKTEQVIVGIFTAGIIGIILDYSFRLLISFIIPWSKTDMKKA